MKQRRKESQIHSFCIILIISLTIYHSTRHSSRTIIIVQRLKRWPFIIKKMFTSFYHKLRTKDKKIILDPLALYYIDYFVNNLSYVQLSSRAVKIVQQVKRWPLIILKMFTSFYHKLRTKDKKRILDPLALYYVTYIDYFINNLSYVPTFILDSHNCLVVKTLVSHHNGADQLEDKNQEKIPKSLAVYYIDCSIDNLSYARHLSSWTL